MKEVEAIVEELDIRRAQVLIEAAIVEISDGLSKALGAQLAVGDLQGNAPAVVTNFSNVGISASAVLAAIANQSTTVSVGDIAAMGIGEKKDNGHQLGRSGSSPGDQRSG